MVHPAPRIIKAPMPNKASKDGSGNPPHPIVNPQVHGQNRSQLPAEKNKNCNRNVLPSISLAFQFIAYQLVGEPLKVLEMAGFRKAWNPQKFPASACSLQATIRNIHLLVS